MLYPSGYPRAPLAGMLKRELAGVLPASELAMMWSAFDQVGDIIIVRIPDGLSHRKSLIGETLLERSGPARSVFAQSSPVGGEHRTRGLELHAGEDRTLTEHTENGCRLLVDVEKAFFSPRLSTERMRIAEACSDGETVVNMFGGVGAFSLAIARARKCTVYSIDVNAEAARLCAANARRNKLKGRVISVAGDAASATWGMDNISSRTLMVLPERSAEFLPDALRVSAPGGIVHYYAHTHSYKKSGATSAARENLAAACPGRLDVLGARRVRTVGPGYHQTVVDARVR